MAVDTTQLSPRLREVHEMALQGLSEKQIALRLHRSIHTVHRHINRLYQALGVGTRAELFVLRDQREKRDPTVKLG